MKIARILLTLALFCAGGIVRAETYTFGVTPLKAASRLAEEWGPLLDEVGRRAGLRLVFRTAPSIPAFGERLAAGEYDFAYMNPYHYKLSSEHPGYRAIAREKDRPLEGVIIVNKGSRFMTMEDLQGATLIFPTPLAFAASLLTQAELDIRGIEIRARYVQSHDSVFRGVATGSFDGGGTIMKVFQTTDPELARNVRVLAKTAAYRPHPIAVHPRVSAEARERVRKAWISLGSDKAGKELLKGIAFAGVESAEDKDYDDIRALRLDKLIQAVK